MSAFPTDPQSGADDTLVHALRVLRRRWIVVALAALACLGAALAYRALSTPVYEASAEVVFGAPTLSDTALQVDRGGVDPEREAATNVLIAESEEVATGVRRALRSSASPADLLASVSVAAEENANVLAITATAETPGAAAAIANAFADQYIAFKSRSEVQSIRAAEADLRGQLAGAGPDAPERASLEASLQRLAELRAVTNGDARVIGRAAAPDAPARLGLVPLAVVGLIIGLAVGLVLAFLIESVDRRINTIEEIEGEYRLGALTAVPDSAFRHERAEQRVEDLEPYRILRSALEFTRVTRELGTVMVTSAVPGEGKTTVAVDLAHTIALAGRRVVLIELDLRRPTFATHLNVDPRIGLTTALLHRHPVAGLLQRPFPALPEFSVLASGRLPPNPAELLGSDAFTDVLAELAGPDTMLILDAPPLIPVADAHILLNTPAITGALVVARLGYTTRDQVRRSRAVLNRHVLQALGVVITGMQHEARYGYAPYHAEDPVGDLDAAPLPTGRRSIRS